MPALCRGHPRSPPRLVVSLSGADHGAVWARLNTKSAKEAKGEARRRPSRSNSTMRAPTWRAASFAAAPLPRQPGANGASHRCLDHCLPDVALREVGSRSLSFPEDARTQRSPSVFALRGFAETRGSEGGSATKTVALRFDHASADVARADLCSLCDLGVRFPGE